MRMTHSTTVTTAMVNCFEFIAYCVRDYSDMAATGAQRDFQFNYIFSLTDDF